MAKLSDALQGEKVLVNATVLADDDERTQRTVMVQVGIRDEMPTTRVGKLADLDQLVLEAWIAHGEVVTAVPDDEGTVLATADAGDIELYGDGVL